MCPDKIALIDCDQCLQATYRYILDQYVPRLFGQPITEWDLLEMLTEDEHRLVIKGLKDPMTWFRAPPLDGAQEGVDKLRLHGFEPVVVTAPWDSCKEWGHYRRKWLKRKFDISREQVIITHRKDLVYGDLFIEDKAVTLQAWASRWFGKLPLLMDWPYNECVDDCRVACMRGWSDLDGILENC